MDSSLWFDIINLDSQLYISRGVRLTIKHEGHQELNLRKIYVRIKGENTITYPMVVNLSQP